MGELGAQSSLGVQGAVPPPRATAPAAPRAAQVQVYGRIAVSQRPDNEAMRADKPFTPLSDAERDQLEAFLDALPPSLEPPDLSALDGFLVGVLLQPRPVERERWLRHAHDLEGRTA